MPTTNPRVSITLHPESLAILDRFSKATGQPRATLLAELVESVLPELQKAAELIELAAQAPEKVRTDLKADLAKATDEMMGSVDEYHQTFRKAMDMVSPPSGKKPASKKASGAKKAAGSRPARPPRKDPHLLTGGSN